MKTYTPDKIRNVGLLGHSGAGKTCIAEAMLYDSGGVTRMGKIADGSTTMDFDPEEIKRQLSISASIASCEWKNHKINVIDTPGDQNFVSEAFLCIPIMDAAIVVIAADEGIRANTERLWDRAAERKLPRVLFINKMDAERASYSTVIDQIHETFHQKILRLTIPIGHGAAFRGVVDLLYMRAYIYEKDGEGKFTTEEIPADLKDLADKERQELVESVAETDEKLLDQFMTTGALKDEDLYAGFRRAVLAGDVSPVVAGSAALNIVIRKTLDLIVNFLPSPLDAPPRPAENESGATVDIKPDPNGPPLAFVFKTIADPYAGKLSVLRVFSGVFASDSNVINSQRGEKEHLGQLEALQGKKQNPVKEAVVGDIAAIAKLKLTTTGDTLAGGKERIVFPKVAAQQPVISYAIIPKSKSDEDKVSGALHRLEEEDPTLRVGVDKQTKERILSGMGQTHIEVVVSKLREKFGVEVDLKPPRIAYKETIKAKAKGHGRHKKQTGGHGQFADCHLEIEPLRNGQEFEFVNGIVGGVIPRQYIPGVEKGALEAMADGVLAGYPITGVRVTVVDGKYHEVDSSELAFKIASRTAFKEAFLQAKPVLLEPMAALEITVPDECVGDVMGDLNHRRGRVQGVDSRGGAQVISATAPMAEILTYAPDLRSMTGGRGQFVMHPGAYEEAPAHIAQKIIEAAAKTREESK